MSEPLLPDLPAALASLIQSLYPDEELARRALLAPWPLLGFRSAYDERHLWAVGTLADGIGLERADRLALSKLLLIGQKRHQAKPNGPHAGSHKSS